MAVPTIVSISPAEGPAVGGNRVVITGTGFKTPTLTLGATPPTDIPTVQVTFGGVACPLVKVVSSTSLEVMPPWYRGATASGSPPQQADTTFPVDVAVSNLSGGAGGTVIPGETATSSGGYSYARWLLGPPETKGMFSVTVEAWITRLLREVCKTVALTTSSRFAEGAAIRGAEAALPSVNLTVRFDLNRQLNHENQSKMSVADPADPDRFLRFEGMRTYNAVMTMLLCGETMGEALELADSLLDGIEIQPYLYLPADTAVWPDRTYEKVPMEVTRDPEEVAGENTWGIATFLAEVTMVGVRVKPRLPRERLWKIDQFTVYRAGESVVVS